MQRLEWPSYSLNTNVRFPTTLGVITINGNMNDGKFVVVVTYNANDESSWQTHGRHFKIKEDAVEWGNQTAKKLVLEEAALLMGL